MGSAKAVVAASARMTVFTESMVTMFIERRRESIRAIEIGRRVGTRRLQGRKSKASAMSRTRRTSNPTYLEGCNEKKLASGNQTRWCTKPVRGSRGMSDSPAQLTAFISLWAHPEASGRQRVAHITFPRQKDREVQEGTRRPGTHVGVIRASSAQCCLLDPPWRPNPDLQRPTILVCGATYEDHSHNCSYLLNVIMQLGLQRPLASTALPSIERGFRIR
jgi:hypothetical protein